MDISLLQKRLQQATDKQNEIASKMTKLKEEESLVQNEFIVIGKELDLFADEQEGERQEEEAKRLHIGSRFEKDDFLKYSKVVEFLADRYDLDIDNAKTLRAFVKYIGDHRDVLNFLELRPYLEKEIDILFEMRSKRSKSYQQMKI